MEEEVFLEEKEKLKEIVKKLHVEEEQLEKSLSGADMNYDLENIAKAKVLLSRNKKIIGHKKYKR